MSQRWASTNTSDTVESERSLDINRLNRAGCLRPGYRGGWEWKRDGKRVADVVLLATVDQLMLGYRVRKRGGEWRDVEQPTQIFWVTCRFGGWRPYFRCPGRVCGRLVSKLYGAGTYFLCLQAAGITSLGGIAAALNARGVRTARGGAWHSSTVRNLMLRTRE